MRGIFDENIAAELDLTRNRMKHAWVKFAEIRGKGSFNKKRERE